MSKDVSMSTLGEVDPEFCALLKACVRDKAPMEWVSVYVKDRYGLDSPVESV